MKKIIFILFLLLFLPSCSEIHDLFENNPGKLNDSVELYLQSNLAVDLVDRLIVWDEYPGSGPSICFMGDSRVQQFPVSLYWPGRHMWNIAMGGSTLFGVEYRIPRVRIFQPDIVYISVGANDIIWDRDRDWIARYGAVIDEIKTFCSRIYVSSIVPLAGSYLNSHEVNAQARQMNEELRTLCDEKDAAFIDLAALEDGSGELKPEFSNDGIHFNKQGYDMIYSIVKSYF